MRSIMLGCKEHSFKRSYVVSLRYNDNEVVLAKVTKVNDSTIEARELYFYEKFWVQIKQYISICLNHLKWHMRNILRKRKSNKKDFYVTSWKI